ncbi:MAG TPA: hypothetical protein VGF67_24935 [Ktedonobacteraceae bacterium]|jgi:hypothetical protein
MSKKQVLQELAEAYEQVIATALAARQRGSAGRTQAWGAREIIAHMAGWEIITGVDLPRVVAGLPPLEFADSAQQHALDDAINAALVRLSGNQSLEALCALLRQAYQSNIEFLRTLDERFFQPGAYAYDYWQTVSEHCREHREQLAPAQV